jgi:UDP-GlcNAc:undecaprenyl-phosphate GlcNAc-1-phosphate transferase
MSYVSSIFWWIINLESWTVKIGSLDVFIIPLIFTIIWYVLVFNSVNWSDGVPGLTVGLSAITLFVILILTIRFYVLDDTPALRENSLFVFFVLSVLLPAVVILWRYNIVPKVLLWDSWTLFLAFMIASLALLVGGKVATVATALWVYLIDAIYVIFARIINGKNPLKGDRIHHLHYRLKSLGMSDRSIRWFVYVIALFFGISAAFLDKTGKILLFVWLVLFVFFITRLLSLKK